MKNKCTVIQINGFRGLLIAGFVLMCAVAGFIIFPAWCCQQLWNYIAEFAGSMPAMQLRHGALLWLIIVLIAYATMFGRFKVRVLSGEDAPSDLQRDMDNLELIKGLKKEALKNIDKEEIKK